MPGRQHFLAARAQGRRCGQKNQPLRRPRRRVGQGAARGDEKNSDQRGRSPSPRPEGSLSPLFGGWAAGAWAADLPKGMDSC